MSQAEISVCTGTWIRKCGHQGVEDVCVHTWSAFPGMCLRCTVGSEAGWMGKNHVIVRSLSFFWRSWKGTKGYRANTWHNQIEPSLVTQNVVPRPLALAPCRGLLGMQNLSSTSNPLSQNLHFNKIPQVIGMYLKVAAMLIYKGQQTVKTQRVNILGFASHTVSVATT